MKPISPRSAIEEVCSICGNQFVGAHCPHCLWEGVLGEAGQAGSADGEQPYEILQELGRGGVGVVYKARAKSSMDEVALKMLLPGTVLSEARQRFLVEAQALAELRHPSILPLYDYGEMDGQPYFTTRLARGGSLSKRLKEGQGPATHEETARLMASLASAVAYAHQRGVLHRDLKPSNVLFDELDQPLLADFGLARVAGMDLFLTRTGVMGTPHYMAPEIVEHGAKYATTSSDIYGLGAMLHELLSGQPPFHSENLNQLLRDIVDDDPPPPSSIVEGIPRDLELICLKALSKEPSKRYSSSQALANDLTAWAKGEPIEARPITWHERMRRWANKHRAAVALITLGVLSLGSVGVITVFSAIRIAGAESRTRQSNILLRENIGRLEGEFVDGLLYKGQADMAIARVGRLLRDQPRHKPYSEYLLNALLHLEFSIPEFVRQGDSPSEHFVFRRNGQSILTINNDGVLNEYRTSDGSLVRSVNQPNSPKPIIRSPQKLFLGPDESYLAYQSSSGAVYILDPITSLPKFPAFKPEVELADIRPRENAGQEMQVARNILLVYHRQFASPTAWDVQTGQKLFALPPHHRGAHGLTVSDKAGLIATASYDERVRLFQLDSGRPVGDPLVAPHQIHQLLFDPLGEFLVAACYNKVIVWNLSDRREKTIYLSPSRRGIRVMAFSPDGATLAIGDHHGSISVYEIASERVTISLNHDDVVDGLDYSPDGSRLLSWSKDNTARLWDLQTGRALIQPQRHSEQLLQAGFSPDGKFLATSGKDGRMILWTASPSRTQKMTFRHPEGFLNFASYSPSQKLIATGGRVRDVMLWAADTGEQIAALPAASGSQAEFHPREELLAFSGTSGKVRIWSIPKKQTVKELTETGKNLRFSSVGANLLVADQHKISCWSTGQWAAPLWSSSFEASITHIGWSPDSSIALATFDDGSLYRWDAKTGNAAGRRIRHGTDLAMAKISPDGLLIATASHNNTAQIWDLETSDPVFHGGVPIVFHHDRSVVDVDFSSDGRQLLTGSYDGTAALWDTRTGARLLPPLRHSNRVNAIRFSPSMTHFATASSDMTAKIWDVSSGLPSSVPLTHEGVVRTLEWSADGRRILTSSGDGKAQVWELALLDGTPPDWLPQLADAVTGIQLDEIGVARQLSWPERQELIRFFQSLPGDDVASRVARWYFSDRSKRSASPFR